MTNVTDRINNLTQEAAANAFEAGAAYQQTTLALVEALAETYKSNAEVARSYGLKGLEQSQEVQNIWLRYFDETTKNSADAFKSAAKDVSAQLEGFEREVRKAGRKAEPAGK